MSHTAETKNLKLPLFQENDEPTWLGDFNSAMDNIDETVGELSVTQNVDSEKINNNTDAIGTLTDTVNGMQSSINTLVTTTAGLSERMTLGETHDNEQDTRLTSLESRTNLIDSVISTIQGDIDDISSETDQSINELTSKVNEVKDSLITFQQETSQDFTQLTNKVNDVQQIANSAYNKADANQTSIQSLTAEINEMSGDVSALEADIAKVYAKNQYEYKTVERTVSGLSISAGTSVSTIPQQILNSPSGAIWCVDEQIHVVIGNTEVRATFTGYPVDGNFINKTNSYAIIRTSNDTTEEITGITAIISKLYICKYNAE